MNKALIIIDVQNDFCPHGSLAVPNGDAIIPTINRLMPYFPTVVATQDWHPPGHISFARTHHKEVGDTIATPYGTQHLWPPHCLQASTGAELHPSLNVVPIHLIVRKGYALQTDSYSAFFDSQRVSTGLGGWLTDREVQEVFLCGLATDYCVLFSALDSASLSFRTTVIADAIQGVDTPAGSVQRALETMQTHGVGRVSSGALIQSLEQVCTTK